MKVAKTILLGFALLVYSTFPQYYAEKAARWSWSIHAVKDVWYLQYIAFTGRIAGVFIIFSLFWSGAKIILNFVPHKRAGGLVILLFFSFIILSAWYFAWETLDKFDIAFDLAIWSQCLFLYAAGVADSNNKVAVN